MVKQTMKVEEERLLMSLSESDACVEGGNDNVDTSKAETILLPGEDQLPARVANVSRDELRKYVQCKRVGNYLLGKTVGEGSFAKVKEAFHILTGEKVAVKIIDKNRARKDRYVSKNMRREARLLQMIRHPHIVQLLEIVETSQCYYLVFEFADGGDLMDYICRRRKLDEEEVRKFMRQIISAVEYLHRLGIIHRDLKVENLLLDAKKNIKIIDFGLSNTIYSPDPTSENHCATQCGSPAYAAPELLVRKDYGPQIDVWSIGVNLYAMLTGRLPYTVEPFNINTLYHKMLKRQMNAVPDYLSEGCKDFIHQLLNPNPKDRINILEAVRHRWITGGHKEPLQLISCPNYLCEEDLDDRILDHIEGQLKLNSDDVIRDLIENRATKNSCVYHLMLRRLDRYVREYKELISTAPRATAEDRARASPQYNQGKMEAHLSSQHNSRAHDQKASAKTHIMENPFKTIKVALIRQKKARNTTDKAKSTSTKKSSIPGPASRSSSRDEPAHKMNLCQVKRVALVKVSPARRSFLGVSSSYKNLTNSPKPGRRKGPFEGVQNRQNTPKVRRRSHESLSSIGSNSMKRNSFYAKKPPAREDLRRRSVNRSGHVVASPRHSTSKRTQVNVPDDRSLHVPDDKSPREDCDRKSKDYTVETITCETEEDNMEAVTYLYTDKGVVLNRNPSDTTGSAEKTTFTVTDGRHDGQHHVFHSSGKDVIGNPTSTQGSKEDKSDSTKTSEEARPQEAEQNIKVVNAKISSTPTRKEVEILQPISPKLNSSSVPASQARANDRSATKKPCLSQTRDEQSAASQLASDNLVAHSKIPVLAGKCSPRRLSPVSPKEVAFKTSPISSQDPNLDCQFPKHVTSETPPTSSGEPHPTCQSSVLSDKHTSKTPPISSEDPEPHRQSPMSSHNHTSKTPPISSEDREPHRQSPISSHNHTSKTPPISSEDPEPHRQSPISSHNHTPKTPPISSEDPEPHRQSPISSHNHTPKTPPISSEDPEPHRQSPISFHNHTSKTPPISSEDPEPHRQSPISSHNHTSKTSPISKDAPNRRSQSHESLNNLTTKTPPILIADCRPHSQSSVSPNNLTSKTSSYSTGDSLPRRQSPLSPNSLTPKTPLISAESSRRQSPASSNYLTPKTPFISTRHSYSRRPSPVSPSRLTSRIPLLASGDPQSPGTAGKKNVSTLADKYAKCCSVIVVNRPSATDVVASRVKETGKETNELGRNDKPRVTSSADKSNTTVQRTGNSSTHKTNEESASQRKSNPAESSAGTTSAEAETPNKKEAITVNQTETSAMAKSPTTDTSILRSTSEIKPSSAKTEAESLIPRKSSAKELSRPAETAITESPRSTVAERPLQRRPTSTETSVPGQTTATHLTSLRRSSESPVSRNAVSRYSPDSRTRPESLISRRATVSERINSRKSIASPMKYNPANRSTLTSKNGDKSDETTKNTITDINRNETIASAGNSREATTPVNSAKGAAQPWTGDERRKISNYRKSGDTQPTKMTVQRREVRTAPTRYRSRTAKSCS